MSKIPTIYTIDQLRAQILEGRKCLEQVTEKEDCTPKVLAKKMRIELYIAKIIFTYAPSKCPTCA